MRAKLISTAALLLLTSCVPVTLGEPKAQANPRLNGVTWNGGDLSLLEFTPSFVRFDGRLDSVSLSESSTDTSGIVAKARTIVENGSEPLVILAHTPAWLARPVPPDCYEDRRDVPCSSDAMAPKDMAKWQTFIEEVVGDLARAGVTYFEVWNEPNNTRHWADTDERFIETALATHRAVAAVERDTGIDLKIGGPGLGLPGPMIKWYADAVAGQGTPVDFVSWHRYTRDPKDYSADAEYVRTLTDLPMFITEWNHYGKTEVRLSEEGAVFVALSLMEMERSGIWAATFYRSIGDAGLIDAEGTKRPSWRVMNAWSPGELLTTDNDHVRAVRNSEQVQVISVGDFVICNKLTQGLSIFNC